MTKQISCESHDYFEIVCMRHSKIQLTLKDHRSVLGVARDIIRKASSELIVVDSSEGVVEVDLIDVVVLKALNNPIEAHNFEMVF
ncbi:Rho-binding antiterminator [Litoribrevibacter albus]|uniref:Uncharacterized protein n=1 Tax=Litoribrevibacter albus TaxID=1473156 RepID=A0AA37SA48_9GAMM|nr:Rho-binding antiterminator [Litoribrevibacter albus]GLQ31283.1 hypothetical protein GCM10007876_17620 [Litoribrevibacter albus]